MTALFCDVVGSTRLAESLGDPETLAGVMTSFFDRVAAIVERHGGTVDKFAGDAIKATFGYPRAYEDDALRAVRAGVEMRAALEPLNEELRVRHGVELHTRTGINTGEVMAGRAIAGQQLVLGDAQNVAARLEQAAAPGEILIGERTWRLVRDAVEAEALEPLSVKGKSEPVAAYRVARIVPRGGGPPRRLDRPLVGRVRELEAILEECERAVRAPEIRVLTLLGEPGIGKSRLAAEAVARLRARARVLVGHCPAYGERLALWPLGEMVREYSGIRDPVGAEDAAAELARSVETIVDEQAERRWLTSTLAGVSGLPGTPGGLEAEPWSALRRFVEVTASRFPLVLLFEDLHWAEPVLLGFLQELAGSTAEVPLLILATARPDLLERQPPWSDIEGGRTIRLEPLTLEDTGRLISAVAGTAIQGQARQALLERAAGNPLFAEELVLGLLDVGFFRDGASVPDAMRELPVPDTLQAVIAARIDALPEEVRAVLHDAAVVGKTFWVGAVARAGEHPDEEVTSALAELERREMARLDPAAGLADETAYAFTHSLLRTVAYEQLPQEVRAKKHRAVAEWLEEMLGERLVDHADALAHHDLRALDLAEAARASGPEIENLAARASRSVTLAADRALRLSDRDSALRLLKRASSLLRRRDRAADPEVAARAGKAMVTVGEWEMAVETLAPFASSGHPPILRDLGVALCKLHRDRSEGPEYREGQGYLERAAETGDLDAIASLAGTWKGIDDSRVLDLYRRAAEADPADPYPLGNLLEYEVALAGDLAPVAALEPVVRAALERCRAQAAAGDNLPWALYDAGKLSLFLRMPYESLEAYTRAVDLSPASFMVETSLASLDRLAPVEMHLEGLAWARQLLRLGVSARFGGAPRAAGRPLSGPLAIVAGASDPQARIERFAEPLLGGFRDFRGTVISGGTRQGIGSLVGDLGEAYPDGINTIGYAPRSLPEGAVLDDDPGRYRELRLTEASGFSPVEPLRYWTDVLGSGIAPGEVRVIGLGGGKVAAAELRIALALGARVGVARAAGGEAATLLTDEHWSGSRRLRELPAEPEALRAFLALPA